jgi:hypothetical protein
LAEPVHYAYHSDDAKNEDSCKDVLKTGEGFLYDFLLSDTNVIYRVLGSDPHSQVFFPILVSGGLVVNKVVLLHKYVAEDPVLGHVLSFGTEDGYETAVASTLPIEEFSRH